MAVVIVPVPVAQVALLVVKQLVTEVKLLAAHKVLQVVLKVVLR